MYPLISIIVPVYNVERYLESCVNSIIMQTYRNLEIILIDDGSPDSCPEMCDDFSLKDERIKVFHKPNGGVSSARNLGLSKASGEYICFVDSDDLLPADGIMCLYNGIKDNCCQYVAGICIDKGTEYQNKNNADIIIDFNKNPQRLLNYITRAGSYSPYAKIFKSDIIKLNNIRFDENLKCAEDALFIRQYLKFCSSMAFIYKAVYQYNTGNENSLSKKGYIDYCYYYIEKLKALKELVDVLPLTAEEKTNFLSDRAVHGLYISIEHYFLNWKDKNTIKECIDKSISAFDTWIDKNRFNVDISAKEIKWWNKYRSLIFKNQTNKIYSRLQVYYLIFPFVRKIKKFAMKDLHK